MLAEHQTELEEVGEDLLEVMEICSIVNAT